MITYPPLVRFPAVEDAGWQAINDALRGDADPPTSRPASRRPPSPFFA